MGWYGGLLKPGSTLPQLASYRFSSLHSLTWSKSKPCGVKRGGVEGDRHYHYHRKQNWTVDKYKIHGRRNILTCFCLWWQSLSVGECKAILVMCRRTPKVLGAAQTPDLFGPQKLSVECTELATTPQEKGRGVAAGCSRHTRAPWKTAIKADCTNNSVLLEIKMTVG